MPYSYLTPVSHGHGSIAAATAAVIADLEADRHYFFEGRDFSTEELAAHLLTLAAQGYRGEAVGPIAFCRSTAAAVEDEFRIFSSHPAAV